jgi:RNA polymerase sigma factor (sigma-70 family)
MISEELIPQLFKTEYRKIIAVLCKLFGLAHIEIAEDITNDSFLLAAETWPSKGTPENPVAWLYAVAKNKTRDYCKRNNNFRDKIRVQWTKNSATIDEVDVDLSVENIQDSQLKMIFAVCHPSVNAEAQIGLALRILCGFGIEEIAAAFLTNKETINKRLYRAKEQLRQQHLSIELPPAAELNKRLDAVLGTIYLLFNAGYFSSEPAGGGIRKELCLEAMRLNLLLIENDTTNKPKTNALLSLMCFHVSRFDARTTPAGGLILYEDQDRNLWNDDLISKGNFYLTESAKGEEITKYHLEASIAYWHSRKLPTADKWVNILQLYNKLLQIDYSPIAALNRTFALSKTAGKQAAIVEAEKLALTNNHLYFSLLGYLYAGIDKEKSSDQYEKAMGLAKSAADKATILKQMG